MIEWKYNFAKKALDSFTRQTFGFEAFCKVTVEKRGDKYILYLGREGLDDSTITFENKNALCDLHNYLKHALGFKRELDMSKYTNLESHKNFCNIELFNTELTELDTSNLVNLKLLNGKEYILPEPEPDKLDLLINKVEKLEQIILDNKR